MSAAPTSRAILIIDDSSMVRRQVRAALADQLPKDLELIEAADGDDALRILEERTIVLVITDFTMPKMNGLELIGSIRANASSSQVPVIVLSTQASGALVQQGWALGVNAWLKKPFKPAMLVSAVASLISPELQEAKTPCAS